ncbi:MAG TPA: hypothetical protein VEF04_18005 [Blastocatellia bacterium]|nr:hypothetical protein [Blastocatellia bacterium]
MTGAQASSLASVPALRHYTKLGKQTFGIVPSPQDWQAGRLRSSLESWRRVIFRT